MKSWLTCDYAEDEEYTREECHSVTVDEVIPDKPNFKDEIVQNSKSCDDESGTGNLKYAKNPGVTFFNL